MPESPTLRGPMGLFNAKRRAEASAVPGDTKHILLNRNKLAAVTVVA